MSLQTAVPQDKGGEVVSLLLAGCEIAHVLQEVFEERLGVEPVAWLDSTQAQRTEPGLNAPLDSSVTPSLHTITRSPGSSCNESGR
ncbi:MAG TPA: hypothetical protein VGQ10_06635 [Vicinamibacterales bacterium]|jgi:hypothetical protein|nr:hypothetical protein [Vicinamibacterales bacterium]